MGQNLLPLWPTESRFIRALYNIERRGIRVNRSYCETMHDASTSSMDSIASELGFRPSERNALSNFLLTELNLPVVARTPAHKPSFDKAAMQEYDLMLEASENDAAKKVLAFRGWQKADSACYVSYLKLVSPDGRLRPNFKLHGTVTGRLSCEKPNLQQIPRQSDKPWNGGIKNGCFIPEDDDWELWEFDYKTLEFRLAALYANEKTLIESFNNGDDAHQLTADRVGISRHDAKTLNFAILYGAGPGKIKWMLNRTDEETQEILTRFHGEFPGFKAVIRQVTSKANSQGHIKYWSGRKKHYNTRWNRDEGHKAFNALCQGGGAELVKHSMVKSVPLEFESRRRMVMQVHDSVWWEIKKDYVEESITAIKQIMEDWQFPVKFEVDAHRLGTE